MHYYDADAQELFINELKRQNVPYLVKERHGGRWVVWEKGYEDQVGFAKEKVKMFINENLNNLYQSSEEMRSNKRLQIDAAPPRD